MIDWNGSFDSTLEDIKKLSKEEKLKMMNDFSSMMEEQQKSRLHPELLNGWINKDGDFIKIDEIDYHEIWAMKYFAKILNVNWWEVKNHIKKNFDIVTMLDYMCGIGWIKITQWEKSTTPSAVHTLPISEIQEIRLEKIKEKYNKDLKIIFIPKRY